MAEHLERSSGAIQGAHALDRFQTILLASVLLFNGVSVPQAAVVTSERHPQAYRAAALRSINVELVNDLDLVLVDDAFACCCICTHESKALAAPIFVSVQQTG